MKYNSLNYYIFIIFHKFKSSRHMWETITLYKDEPKPDHQVHHPTHTTLPPHPNKATTKTHNCHESTRKLTDNSLPKWSKTKNRSKSLQVTEQQINCLVNFCYRWKQRASLFHGSKQFFNPNKWSFLKPFHLASFRQSHSRSCIFTFKWR